MDVKERVERLLDDAVSTAARDSCPSGLAAAVRHAVFPGGARVRPLLCLGVAMACGERNPLAADAAATSIELLHCASLVHDDLPCFDDADTRRGLPSVHRAFGEPLAVLAGDALIVLAFDVLGRSLGDTPHAIPPLLRIMSRAVGMSGGLVAGQAWESEPNVSLTAYQAAKTGSLFVAATSAGAVSSGHDPAAWEDFGAYLGEAYQVADDIRDAASSSQELGKPVGRDAALDRPSSARQLGLRGAVDHLEVLVERAIQSVPACPGAAELKSQVRRQMRWFVPGAAAQFAA